MIARRRHQLSVSSRDDGRPGQAIIEFAFAGTIFLLIVLGTIDFGRAIFLAAELHNAVREGTAVGRLQPSNEAAIVTAVVDHATGNGLVSDDVDVTCTGGCMTGGTITVEATVDFQAVTQSFLGISPFEIRSSATVDIE